MLIAVLSRLVHQTVLFLAAFLVTIPAALGQGPNLTCSAYLTFRGTQHARDPWLRLAENHFNRYLIARTAEAPDQWLPLLDDLDAGDVSSVSKEIESLSLTEPARLSRFLMVASDEGADLPPDVGNGISGARKERDTLRKSEIVPNHTVLTNTEKVELVNLLSMVGFRRPVFERFVERAKARVGLKSVEYDPIMQANAAPNTLGDEARIAVLDYNSAIAKGTSASGAYAALTARLFALYAERVYEPLTSRWFRVTGKSVNLIDFVNLNAFHQDRQDPSNTWQIVGRLRAETVKNPKMTGKLVREMWWNRDKGIHPNGSVRIARNLNELPDGTEDVQSVEVLLQYNDKIYVPFAFERSEDGSLRQVRNPKEMQSCFVCHMRLNGLWFGGISMKNYKPSPDWYINAIDLVPLRLHSIFKGLVQKNSSEGR